MACEPCKKRREKLKLAAQKCIAKILPTTEVRSEKVGPEKITAEVRSADTDSRGSA